MDNDQGQPGPSDASKGQLPPPNPSENTSQPTGGESKLERLLSKIDGDLQEIKANTKSERNTDAIERIEKSVGKIPDIFSDFMANTWGKLAPSASSVVPEKHEEIKPETPDVSMPSALKFVYIRKRGGRVVKRAVHEGKTA